MISTKAKNVVRATAPVLEKEGIHISTRFYDLLFERNPELRHVFNQSNQKRGTQQRALAETVFHYAANIDELEKLGPAVRRIANKHASLSVEPAHYPIVGTCLLQAIQDHLGLPDGHEILVSWAEAYEFLAALFIDVEESIYRESENEVGGWRGFRSFRIDRIVRETELVSSFYLQPSDGRPIVDFTPGQYVGIRIPLTDTTFCHRQYSLSDTLRNGEYRLTIKSEANDPAHPGEGSTAMHVKSPGDTVMLHAPTGDFVMDGKHRPVFIAGGIGVTPLFAMAKDLSERQPEVLSDTTFIHACPGRSQHPLSSEIAVLSSEYGMELLVSYDEGDEGQNKGYLTAGVLAEWLPEPGRDVYLCGPEGFMAAMVAALVSIGFERSRIRYEAFGPHRELV